MITFTPNKNNQYIVESSNLDFPKILKQTEDLMENNEVAKACQLRYDLTQEILEKLDNMDEIPELDMQNDDNQSVVEIVVKCGIDHYFISDFEISAAILETALELDPEDHFGATAVVGFCYAGLNEWDSMEAIIETGALLNTETEFLNAFSSVEQRKKPTISKDLIEALKNEESELNHIITPLKNSFEETINQILL